MQILLRGVLEDGSTPRQDTPLDLRQTVQFAASSTYTIRVEVFTPGGFKVSLKADDVLVLSLTKRPSVSVPALRVTGVRVPTEGPNIVDFAFLPVNTRNLEPGRYAYTIWLARANGERHQLISVSPLLLEPAIALN